MAVESSKAIPMLRIFDVAKAKEFYVGFLGFQVDWEHTTDGTPPVFLQASRGDLALFLSEHHGDGTPGSAVFVWMTGLSGFHAEITAKGYPYMRPGIEETFYGPKQVSVIDPFGNTIHFNEKVSKP